MNENIAEVTRPYLAARGNMQYRAIDALRFVRDPDIASNMQQFTCRHDFRSVIVIPKNIADLNKAARDYIGL
jgi:hypothetical protein